MFASSRTHLAEVGESYFEHMRFAMLVGLLAIGAGLACILHALIPALCGRTCSGTVAALQRLFADRSQFSAVISENLAVIIFVILTLLSAVIAVAIAISAGGTAVALVALPQAFALPLIFLSGNPQLEAEALS
ncbi:uncharacterized protein DUF6356 [Sphingomonas sp. F9_3S_D5_B_2]